MVNTHSPAKNLANIWCYQFNARHCSLLNMLGWGVNRTLALATIGKRDFFVEPLRMGLLLVARALVLFMAISSQKVPRLQKLTENKVCSEQAGGEFYSWFSASWG
jgi:hypothetical protein